MKYLKKLYVSKNNEKHEFDIGTTKTSYQGTTITMNYQ